MKKQFFRVKQLADQTFLKAEKSEVLNHEELQIADQRFDALKSAIVAINKKICPNGPTNDKEKRLRKCLEFQIGTTFVEESREEKDCALFQHVLKVSGGAEHDLAKEFAEHEAKVEEMVYAPLQKVIENEIPGIVKQKNNLKKYCLDKDSASNRYHATKKETLKEDMEEADTKVEQSRDAFATEMFNLLARENEFSSYILQLLKLQRGYHESALKNLEHVIPLLEKAIGDSDVKRVFGVSLQEHLRVTGRRVAYPLDVCVTALSDLDFLSEEGLFRIAGAMSKIKRLKSAIDSGCFSILIPEYRDAHVLASTLKSYLRELPEPLLSYHLYKEWMHSMQVPENQRVELVKYLLNKLPQENRDNLAYVIQFLARLSHHTKNKMSSSNIAIVMAPNLLWDKSDEINVNMGNCVTVNLLVELLIKEVDTFFPDQISGHLTISALIPDEELVSKNGNNGKLATLEHTDATSTESLLDSPKPQLRKKKPAAPTPPTATNHVRGSHESEEKHPSYPSGSSTLTLPPKGKEHQVKIKATAAVNTEENELSLCRKRSLSKDDIKLLSVAASAHPPLAANLVSDASAAKVIVTQAVSNVSKAQPVIRPVAQTLDEDKNNFKTTVTHQVGDAANSIQKPTAAPRHSLYTEERGVATRNQGDVMSKSHDSAELAEVQLRRTGAIEQRPAKPEIPARPASLAPAKRSSVDIDPTVHRTQCSIYSVANKHQPSIVNIQNRTEKIQLGHDVMMAEKEKFLGHSPAPRSSLENKFNDINSNKDRSRPSSIETKPSVPPKSLILTKSDEKLDLSPTHVSKSSEKLNELNENRIAQKPSHTHTRTRSDGNIMELGQRDFLTHTPPSPRSLNKPTEPPPPPPVIKKPEPESTDF